MSIEITEGARASRWGTQNTKLAACLLVYGYRLCPEQPFIRVASSRDPGKISTSIQFEESHPAHITPDTTQQWGAAWDSWDAVRHKTGRYENPPEWRGPLMLMRRALDARQWFANEGLEQFRRTNDPLPERVFKTDDQLLVVCLISLGLHVFKVEGPRFVFDAAKVGDLHQDYLDDGKPCPMQWAKRACVQIEILVSAIRRPENVANLHMKVGKNIAFIPQNMPPSVREPFVRELYS